MDLLEPIQDSMWSRIALIILTLTVIQLLAKHFMGVLIRRVLRGHKYPTKRAAEQRENTLVSMLGTGTAVILWIVGAMLVLDQLGVNIGAAMTGAGVVGIIIGFGAQSTIKNLLTGFFIIIENQYRVGDIITINKVSGIVEEITIRITKLRDLDGNLHIVQNGDISLVTNRTFGYSNVNIDVGVAYDSDLDKVIDVINATGLALAEDAEWKERVTQPIQFLRVDEFGDSSIVIKSLGRVTPAAQWDVSGEFRRRLKKAFDKAGIEIPFPQRVIHQPKQ